MAMKFDSSLATTFIGPLADADGVPPMGERRAEHMGESIVELVSRYLIALAGLYFVYTAFEKFWK